MPENFQNYLIEKVIVGCSYAKKYLKEGKNPLKLALEDARKKGVPQKLIEKVEEKGMLDGSFEMTYEGAQRIYDKIRKKLDEKGEHSDKDYLGWIENFDEIRDHDLIATGIFCLVPEIRKTMGEENLYKVVLYIGAKKYKGYSLPLKQKVESKGDYILPSNLEDLISNLPTPETDEELEQQRKFKLLLKKKAERDIFPLFKKDKDAAFRLIDKRINEETNEDLLEVYSGLRENYRGYESLKLEQVNLNFEDPNTGEKGVMPSLHQKIGIYDILKHKRFGVFDGCGTGKTAIAVLAQPLIEQELKKNERKFRRVVVICPNTAKKTWKKGLTGNKHERYLAEPQDIMVIDGGMKDDGFLDELQKKRWIVLNYEQMIAKVNSTGRLLVEELADLGVDYLIGDESHHIRSHREITKTGRPTLSTSARALAMRAEYVALLTGSPIPDKLEDYAVPFSILNPEICPDPENFKKLYDGNPRILYTFFNEKTIRRTSDDINDDLEGEEFDETVNLTLEQRKLYDHIIEFRPKNWLMQARKALIDPRLVDPEILERAGVLGNVNYESSSKYKRLEELLENENSPLVKGEKFIIFSSMFREGVTQPGHSELERRYLEVGVEKEFRDTSELERKILIESLQGNFSFAEASSEAVKSLKRKKYVSINKNKITVNKKRNGAVNKYQKTYRELGLDVSLPERLKEKIGVDIGIIDGTITDVQEREKVVEDLKNGLSGILCTTDTGGESLDFSHASHAYFLDEDYTPTTTEQAIYRLIRPGQKNFVNIFHLRGKDTLDETLKDYVTKKEIIGKIAMDGYPLTEDEKRMLEDSEGKHFGELIKRGLGGRSINVLEAGINSINDFHVRKRTSKGSRGGSIFHAVDYNTTEAQEVMRWIGKDRFGCWKDPEFVELYMKALSSLSVPILHRAKICDLIERASRGSIEFPRRVLSEGSGPSLLYNAYQELSRLLRKYGFRIPIIVDRDTSQPMLDKGTNKNRILGDMTGRSSVFKNAEFDMVDNESITLLRNPTEVKESLLEANRILRPNGLIELVAQNWKFSDGFYSGMGNLGFELLNGNNEGFFIGKEMFRRLREEKGEHYARAYANKLANTCVILGRKVDNSADAKDENFWFVSEVEEKEADDEKAKEAPVDDEAGVRKYPKQRRRRKALPGEIPGLSKDLEEDAEIEE